MTEVADARKRWLKEQPTFSRFGKLIENRLRAAVQEKGIRCETTSRPKETSSLIKKLLKGKHTYDSLPDKTGVRCIVRYRSELAVVLSLAQSLFECSKPDDKSAELGIDRVGYESIHVQVNLKRGDPGTKRYGPSKYSAELQIRTLGQHVWSEMSHDSFYKSDEALSALPVDLQRRVHLMAGLIEVADQEFDRLNREAALSPEAQLYKALEQYYYRLAAKRPDPTLSLEVIRVLLPLYGIEVPQITKRLEGYFEAHRSELQHVYAEAEESTASPFLYQPEVLMILERLEANQLKTRKAWALRFPPSELEDVANAFGISFD